MTSNEFKDMFNEVAIDHGFEKAYGGWLKESAECIAVLVLQKSNYGNYYQLIIKINIQGVFGTNYVKNKHLVKNEVGHIRSGEPKEYRQLFNLDSVMEASKRKEKLETLFSTHIVPFIDKTLTRRGIISMYQNEELFLLPAIKSELGLQ